MDRGGRSQMQVFCKVFCDVQADVTCRGYDSILLSARVTVNQGGTADHLYVFVLDRENRSVKDVFDF